MYFNPYIGICLLRVKGETDRGINILIFIMIFQYKIKSCNPTTPNTYFDANNQVQSIKSYPILLNHITTNQSSHVNQTGPKY